MSTVQLRLTPADQGRRMTLVEFREAEEEEGYRFELGGGVLEVTEIPGPAHFARCLQPVSGDRAV